MEIYLPIAEIPINIFLLLFLGFFVGILSGLFGIGGGFIITPLLIFMGVSPVVAVASSSNQIVASSFSGFRTHSRKNNVDYKMGIILIIGGLFGSTTGVYLFNILRNLGQIDLTISLLYIFVLGSIGIYMGYEEMKTLFNIKNKHSLSENIEKKESILFKIPFKMSFAKSELEINILIPIFLSFFAGIIIVIMGIGGGFIMIPLMIYILRIPTNVVVGTSLLQIIFVTGNATILYAITNHSVDIVLAGILLTTSVIGVQIGTKIGTIIPAYKLRLFLALMIIGVVTKLILGFIIDPVNPFEVISN